MIFHFGIGLSRDLTLQPMAYSQTGTSRSRITYKTIKKILISVCMCVRMYSLTYLRLKAYIFIRKLSNYT